MDSKNNEKSTLMKKISFQHLDKSERIAIYQQVSNTTGMSPVAIEKDWWVTQTLSIIFEMDIAQFLVFKGGTALSKCHKLIERFSEDVDIVVIKNLNESNNKLKSKLKEITDTVNEIFPEIEIQGITNKLGMIRKTAHSYKKQNFRGDFGQVREQIIIEATWLGSSEPSITAEISSYIYDMMVATNQLQIIESSRTRIKQLYRQTEHYVPHLPKRNP